MIRLAPLITADVDTTTLPGGKASDAAQDFLALLSEALAGETTTDKAAPQLLVATDKPTTKGEPLVSEILADAQQADLLIPVDETPPVINDEQSTSTPLTTAQTMTLAAVAGNNTAKDEKADDLNEDVTASLSALFAMLPGFDNTPKVTDVPSTVLPAEKPTLFTKLTSAQLTTAQPDDAPGTPAQPLTPLVAEAQSKAEVISTPSPVTAAASPLITPHQTQPLPTVAAPVLSAPLGSHEWQQSLSQHISLFTRQGQQSAELRLHPQDLGEVQISLKVDDNQAQIQMVSPHQHVRAALEAALPVLRTQLAEWTGLSRSQAALTQLHEASVTLIWRDSDERMAQFTARLNELGLQFMQGARFWHVLDASAGKDQAANWIIATYQQLSGKPPTTLGLGDGPNDAPLLEVMDYAVIVKGLNREGVHLHDEDPTRVWRTQREGPEGWREGLDHFFSAR